MPRRRKNPKRLKPQRKIVLILVSGSDEYNYLGSLKTTKWRYYDLRIEPKYPAKKKGNQTSGQNILNLMEKAEKALKGNFDIFKLIPDYVVFLVDLDEICRDETLKAKYLKRKKHLISKFSGKVRFIETYPCLEFWYLLHHKYTTASFNDCESVMSYLKKNPAFSEYDKSDEWYSKHQIFDLLGGNKGLTRAIDNAKRLLEAQRKVQDLSKEPKCFPYTNFAELFDFIDGLLSDDLSP